jgi:hypothetical protein
MSADTDVFQDFSELFVFESFNFNIIVTHLDNFIHNNFSLFLIRCGGMVDKLCYVRFSQIVNTHFVSLQHYLSKIESGC